jgi:hypothetical protein
VVGAVVVGDGGGRGSRGLGRLLVRRHFERWREQPLPPAVIPVATLAVGAGKEGRRHRQASPAMGSLAGCRDLGWGTGGERGGGGQEGERGDLARVSPSGAVYIPSHPRTAG